MNMAHALRKLIISLKRQAFQFLFSKHLLNLDTCNLKILSLEEFIG
jgi:hypothetical protein